MSKRLSVLFVGESWMIQTTESKGVDSFTVYRYEECTKWVAEGLTEAGMSFNHIPCHLVEYKFPETLEELEKFDVVMLSDVGANTMLLSSRTFNNGIRSVNKLDLIRDYVNNGGGFCMIGGYLTYQGFEAKGCYKRTSIEDILPVNLLEGDDRAEYPQGILPTIEKKDHVIFDGIDEQFPHMLGYNRTILKDEADLLMKYNNDPLISVWNYGKGRVMAYACDCSPHWASPELCNWKYYKKLWQNITAWLAGAQDSST